MPFVFEKEKKEAKESRFVFEKEEPTEKKQKFAVDLSQAGPVPLLPQPDLKQLASIAEGVPGTLGSLAVAMAAWPVSLLVKYGSLLPKRDLTLSEKVIYGSRGKVEPETRTLKERFREGKKLEEAIMSIPGMFATQPGEQTIMGAVAKPFEYLEKGLRKVAAPLPEIPEEIAVDLATLATLAAVPKVARGVKKRVGLKKTPEQLAKTPESQFLQKEFKERFIFEPEIPEKPTIAVLQKKVDKGLENNVKVDAVGEKGLALATDQAQVTVLDPKTPADKATFNVPIDNIVEATQKKITGFEKARAEAKPKLKPTTIKKRIDKKTGKVTHVLPEKGSISGDEATGYYIFDRRGNIISETEIAEPYKTVEAARKALEAYKEPVKPKAREPWEMTRDEYVKLTRKDALKESDVKKDGMVFVRAQENQARIHHPVAVEQALSEGKPVPPSVLKDYPELAKPTPKPKAPRQRAVVKPEGVKKPKHRTLRGAIVSMGKIDFLHFTGELKEMDLSVKYLKKKGGLPIDVMEKALKDDKWLYPEENLLDVLRDSKNLSRDRITADVLAKREHELSAQERRVKEEIKREPEAPPKGEYKTIRAEDLPEGKKLTIIEGKSTEGWDTYIVKEKDPFSIKLIDGKEIELKPFDQVQVLKKDIGKPVSKPEMSVRKDKTKGPTLYSGIPGPEIKKLGDIWTKNVGEPIWDKLVMQKIPKMLEKVPGGKSINRAAIYDYRGDLPSTAKYIKSLDDMRRFQAIGREYGIDVGRRLQAATEKSQIRMGESIRGELEIKDLKPSEKRLVGEAKRALYTLGKQAVDVGLLAEKTFFKHAGRYMPRLYNTKEYQTLLTRYNLTKPNRLDLSRFKRRKDIPKKVRQQMGEILTPGYPVAKGITQLTHDIELAKFFNGVAKNPDWAITKIAKDVPVPDGWKQLPENKKLGSLSEAHVHPEIFADLKETIRVMETPERVWRKALGFWKFGKVIISPKTHARNLMSNSVLAHLGGMPMYEQPVYLIKAAKHLKQKGKLWKKAREEGLLTDTFTNAELRTLFDRVEGAMTGIKAGSIPEAMGIIGKSWQKTKTAGRGAAKLYELEEQWFKMAKFIHNVERKKMGVTAAAKDAEKWLFNYRKVTKFQEKYRTKWYGAPFATFTFKAMPRVMEAAVKYPWRFALPTAIIYALEQAAMTKIGDTKAEYEAKKELRPEYMRKGKFLGVIPNWARVALIDDYGREHYLNLTYILPWGDIAEGGEFMGIPGSLRPISQPFVSELAQQIANYDFFFKSEIAPEKELVGKAKWDKIAKEAELRGKHALRTFAPTPAIDVVKGVAALKGKPDYRGRLRAPKVVALDVFAGIKLYPVDYADQLQRQISKADPKKGVIARKIKSQIKTFSIKRKAMKDAGKPTELYDKLIEDKIKQLQGMAKDVIKIGEAARKAGLR